MRTTATLCTLAALALAPALSTAPTADERVLAYAAEADGRERALPRLSDYGFFEGPLAELRPAPNVHPYALNTPLFSDYAAKARFVYLPADSTMRWRDREVLDLPVGAYLIKHFYYPADAREPDGPRRLLETRLLRHTPEGWKAWGYWWDDDQADAEYKPLGGRASVDFVDGEGRPRHIDYVSPNQIQCRSCHNYDGEIRPIGPSARQLHGGSRDYLTEWRDAGLLAGAPADVSTWPSMDWRADGVSDEGAARAYLDANCGYCHRPEGPASTSGLMLAWDTPTGPLTGVLKSPVAAGKGSGGRKYDVEPGHPERSILVYRLESTDAAVRMPEVGRTVVDEEGVAVVRRWVAGL